MKDVEPEDVTTLFVVLADIRNDVGGIRRLLEEDDGEERKIPRKDWTAYDERTRMIEARTAELRRQVEAKKRGY